MNSAPCPCVPTPRVEETFVTDAGESLTSCTPSAREATMAYVPPLLASSNASTPCAPPSLSSSPSSSPTAPADSRVPSARTPAICRPFSPLDAISRYVRPPSSNAAASLGPPSRQKLRSPSPTESAATIDSSLRMRTSCAWLPLSGVTRASVPLPSGAAKAVTNMALASRAKPAWLLVADVRASSVPFSWTRISCTALSWYDATRAYVLPLAIRKAATPPAPLSARPPTSVSWWTGARVPSSRTRIDWTPLSATEATTAYVLPLASRNASTDRAPSSSRRPASVIW